MFTIHPLILIFFNTAYLTAMRCGERGIRTLDAL